MIYDMIKKNRFLARVYNFFLGDKSSGQFIRYLITGFSTFTLEFLLFFSMYKLLSINELISNSVAITIIFWFNFLMNRFWSFKSKEKIIRQLMLYGILFVFNIGISNLFIYAALSIFYISPLISKILIMGIIVMWNFVLYKTVIYKK